jgi:hypothetical protein
LTNTLGGDTDSTAFGLCDSRDAMTSSIFADRDHHTTGGERTYLLVPSNSPREALAAKLRAPRAPDLCVRSPSEEARHAAETAFAGAYVRTIVEPLLARRRRDETDGDFRWRCADALRTLYAFETRTALVVYDELPGSSASVLELEEHDLLRIADELEQAAPSP